MISAEIAERLEGRPTGDGRWSARCPAHEDRNASLSISAGDRKTLIKCFAGCDTSAVVAAAGLTMADLFEGSARTNTPRLNALATYTYADETGAELFQVVRLEPKSFRQRHKAKPTEKADREGWCWNTTGIRRVLYRLPEVSAAAKTGSTIWVVEGEKDVDGLLGLGLVATCNAGGAGKWRAEYTESLYGAAQVVVVADKDEPGRKHARLVSRSLTKARIPSKVVEVPTGKDASDWIAAGAGRADFEDLASGLTTDEPPPDPETAASASASDPASSADGEGGSPEPPPLEDEDGPDSFSDKKGPSKASQLIKLALGQGIKLFNGGDGRAFSLFPDGRVLPMRSREFRGFLEVLFWRAKQTAPGSETIADTVNHFEGSALFEGAMRRVYVRVAPLEGGLCLDLGGPDLSCIEVRGDGWAICERPNVLFLRPSGQLPLPRPERGGSLDELRQLLNLGTGEEADHRWALIAAFQVNALHPVGPYAGLAIGGEQGSAKSHGARLIRSTIDPSKALLRTLPRDERDLAISASRSWIGAFDNVSSLNGWSSDALCRVATGGGLATRTLYTDGDETIFDFKRPILLNGIDPAFRPDLMDRLYLVMLPTIGRGQHRLESEIDAEFARLHPRILGGLLDAASTALRRLSGIRLVSTPRMADVARWAAAAEPSLGVKTGAIERALSGNREDATEVTLEGSPIVAYLRKLPLPWSGSSTELLELLNSNFDKPGRPDRWPKSAQVLSGELRRIAPNLRQAGILDAVWPSGRRNGRRIELRPICDSPPVDAEQRPPRPQASSSNGQSVETEDDVSRYRRLSSSEVLPVNAGDHRLKDHEDEEDAWSPELGEGTRRVEDDPPFEEEAVTNHPNQPSPPLRESGEDEDEVPHDCACGASFPCPGGGCVCPRCGLPPVGGHRPAPAPQSTCLSSNVEQHEGAHDGR